MKKILVIDDNQSLLKIMEILLEENNFLPIITTSGLEGISLAKSRKADLIICDLNMPEINGLDLLEKLRNEPETATIPFIFLTADDDKQNLRAGMNLGADDYLNKPVVPSELIASINRRLEKSELILKNNQQKMERLSKNIMYALPHELNTPLFTILGCSELIKDITENSQIKELSEMIFSSSKRLENLIRKYLIFTQVEIIRSDLPQIAELNNMVVEQPGSIIEEIAKNFATGRQDDLILETLNEKIQASQENYWQVIEEITENAFKFSKKGTKVEIKTSLQENYYMVCITDQGRGFTPAQLENIGAYMQFDREIYEQQGMGLGLIIARKLTELHGGTFEISSIKNNGTTVKIGFKCLDR
jgi:two-component system sensor histidine kinase/response regulator